ncbi:hypothetical protein [Paraburkholderia sp.]|uniref:hypothetical protein n=1 Tax=Paraburkholderia sp. TaxID=1926495 RepID=UPI0039E2ABF8
MYLPHPTLHPRRVFGKLDPRPLRTLSHTDPLMYRLHTPMPPEVDPQTPPKTPPPNIDPDPLPDDPLGDPDDTPEGDPPASPPPLHASCAGNTQVHSLRPSRTNRPYRSADNHQEWT